MKANICGHEATREQMRASNFDAVPPGAHRTEGGACSGRPSRLLARPVCAWRAQASGLPDKFSSFEARCSSKQSPLLTRDCRPKQKLTQRPPPRSSAVPAMMATDKPVSERAHAPALLRARVCGRQNACVCERTKHEKKQTPPRTSQRFLVFGRSGWIGGLLGDLLTSQGADFEYASARLEQRDAILADIERVRFGLRPGPCETKITAHGRHLPRLLGHFLGNDNPRQRVGSVAGRRLRACPRIGACTIHVFRGASQTVLRHMAALLHRDGHACTRWRACRVCTVC